MLATGALAWKAGTLLRPAYYRTKYEFLFYYDDGRQRVICRFLPGTLFVGFRLFQHITDAALAKTVVWGRLVIKQSFEVGWYSYKKLYILIQSTNIAYLISIFTESAARPIQSRSLDSLCICLSVPSRVIVDYAQFVKVSVFCHKINFICFSL